MMTRRFDKGGGALSPPRETNRSWIVVGVAAREHPIGDPLRYAASGNEHRDMAATREIARQLNTGKIRLVLDHDDDQPVGHVRRSWVDDGKVMVELEISKAQVKSLDSIPKELSLGYATDVRTDEREIKWQDSPTVFHLSLVTRGRCSNDSTTCGIKIDSSESYAAAALRWRTENAWRSDLGEAVYSETRQEADADTTLDSAKKKKPVESDLDDDEDTCGCESDDEDECECDDESEEIDESRDDAADDLIRATKRAAARSRDAWRRKA